MVQVDLFYFDDHFWSLLPSHRKMVNDLLVRGVIEMYAISEDRAQGWIIFNAMNERDVKMLIDKFPIRDYFQYEIIPLMILNNSESLWPKVHLN